MSSKVSVIICAYTEQRWNALIVAVDSVQNQTLPAEEIIIVIDHNPALLLKVQEHLPGVVALENSGEKGLAGARNSGWEKARGEFIAFLDDDAVADPTWLEYLTSCYTDPAIAGTGGSIIPLWESAHPSWFPAEFAWVIGCTYRGMPAHNAPVRNPIGANMSVRKSILAAVGGFSEAFGWDRDTSAPVKTRKRLQASVGDEETELCIRVSQHLPDCIWLYIPAAVVQHRVPAQRTRWIYFLQRCYGEGLGKARLVKVHSSSTGLSSERTYTFKTLPQGVARGFADAIFRFDLSGILRAAAIVLGLATTTMGYLMGMFFSPQDNARQIHLASLSQQQSAEIPAPVEVR